jgi:tetratricopeptide (TPR) repeat protein
VVRSGDLDEGELRIPWTRSTPSPRALSRQEVLEQLGGLAIAIGKQKLAAEYFEKAGETGPPPPTALASFGDLLESNGDRSGADARYEAALAAAPDDPLLHVRFADLLRARAETSQDPAERAALAERARGHYARSIELSEAIAEAHAGLAALHLVDGRDPAGSLAHARMAQNLLPGDPEIGLLAARLELAVGDRDAARAMATNAMTRARSASDLAAARSVLAQIDERASIR